MRLLQSLRSMATNIGPERAACRPLPLGRIAPSNIGEANSACARLVPITGAAVATIRANGPEWFHKDETSGFRSKPDLLSSDLCNVQEAAKRSQQSGGAQLGRRFVPPC